MHQLCKTNDNNKSVLESIREQEKNYWKKKKKVRHAWSYRNTITNSKSRQLNSACTAKLGLIIKNLTNFFEFESLFKYFLQTQKIFNSSFSLLEQLNKFFNSNLYLNSNTSYNSKFFNFPWLEENQTEIFNSNLSNPKFEISVWIGESLFFKFLKFESKM